MKIRSDTNKNGQMTIFVIIAIVIVAVIILLIYIKKSPATTTQQITSPQELIQKCAKDAASEAIGKMMPQGGFVNPINFRPYNGINVSYLCETKGNNQPCINQHPVLLNDERQEIKNYISPVVEKCFEDYKSQNSGGNEQVQYGDMNLDVSLAPGKVLVSIQRNITIKKNGETTTYNQYNTVISSPLYDLANVAIEIANQQEKYCYFEYPGYMILHPQFVISVFTFSDSSKIYSIEDESSGDKFNIAVRSCAIAPIT